MTTTRQTSPRDDGGRSIAPPPVAESSLFKVFRVDRYPDLKYPQLIRCSRWVWVADADSPDDAHEAAQVRGPGEYEVWSNVTFPDEFLFWSGADQDRWKESHGLMRSGALGDDDAEPIDRFWVYAEPTPDPEPCVMVAA